MAWLLPFQSTRSESGSGSGSHWHSHGNYSIARLRIPAINGTWISYQLVQRSSDDIARKPEFVTAWFVAHEDVEPQAEVGRILKVAGSPCESDKAVFNTPERKAAGVLVINRHDWGQYDVRGEEDMKSALKGKGVAKKKEADGGDKADEKGDKEEFSDEDEDDSDEEVDDSEEEFEDDEDEDEDEDYCHVGLVDSVHAKSRVLEWKTQKGGERTSSSSGVWLYTPEVAHMYARFGFNEECTAARSFLWFTGNTEFTHTAFSGLGKPLLPKRSRRPKKTRNGSFKRKGVRNDAREAGRRAEF